MSDHNSSSKAILYALVANFGIAVSKLLAALYTASGSMLAEAIHSFSDCANQILLFIGLKQSKRPPTREHPLGFGKVTYFWSFVVALLLFTMGGLFSIYEGWHKLHEPEPVSQLWVALTVLGVSILLEAGSLAGCLKEIAHLRGEKSFGYWIKNTRNAELVVVLGEDVAALVGLVLAFGFVGLTAATGDPKFDAMGSITIGVVLVAVAIFIALRIKALIVGRSAEEDVEDAIRQEISEDPGIDQLLKAITMQFGPQVMLAAKVQMKAGLSIEEAVARINKLEVRIHEKFPEIAWCFIEPDDKD
ncbi:MAG: cation transporter [Vicinamibacteria bacterium]|nr:cation transporter [Vicinamibacteria bacterium]